MFPNITRTVFTYGDIIYNPGCIVIPDYLMEHEAVHTRQQKRTQGGADIWWDNYLKSENFRLEQEIEAYGMQCRFLFKRVKEDKERKLLLTETARILSSVTYGNIITKEQAIIKLKNYAM